VCPVLGLPLFPGRGQPTANSPSIDRVDPSLGYVRDNVWVISNRANMIKNDATLEELEALVCALRTKLAKIQEIE
jgi:hypothetical protein